MHTVLTVMGLKDSHSIRSRNVEDPNGSIGFVFQDFCASSALRVEVLASAICCTLLQGGREPDQAKSKALEPRGMWTLTSNSIHLRLAAGANLSVVSPLSPFHPLA
jgi:hypothetical protein